MKRVAVSRVEQPTPIALAPLAYDRDDLLDAPIGLDAGRAQIVERAKYVMVPERGQPELRPRRVDDVDGKRASMPPPP
jgi:hypothetical protein